MIGNDIVDLNLAKIQSNWQRKGFLEKQFTQKEQCAILKAENPFVTVWLFWSMKEAAYKCYTQKSNERFYAPQKFDCRLISETKGIVIFEGNHFYTTSFSSASYIYTTAKEEESERLMFSAVAMPSTLEFDLKNKLAQETGFSVDHIQKVKTTMGAPRFYHQEELLTASCSMSHHGNYGAYAFNLANKL
jgi:phosphopantetheinyl transferase